VFSLHRGGCLRRSDRAQEEENHLPPILSSLFCPETFFRCPRASSMLCHQCTPRFRGGIYRHYSAKRNRIQDRIANKPIVTFYKKRGRGLHQRLLHYTTSLTVLWRFAMPTEQTLTTRPLQCTGTCYETHQGVQYPCPAGDTCKMRHCWPACEVRAVGGEPCSDCPHRQPSTS
jgi:hypothetical protein